MIDGGQRVQAVLTGPDASLGDRVRASLAIVGLARTASLFPDADPAELRRLAVDAALAALDAGEPSGSAARPPVIW